MIQKLRIKFVLLTSLSLLLVLSVIIGSVNLLNYRKIVQNADSTLRLLAENDGEFPKNTKSESAPLASSKPPEYKRRYMSPELPYESRFFSVRADQDGKVLSTDTDRIAAVDSGTAASYAETILSHSRTQGFADDYRYLCSSSGDGFLLVFLDCGKSLSTFRTFLFTSCCISLAGVCAVLLLVLLFSKRIMKPILESYEKQRRFVTDAGHEIKTPLAVIAADADVLEMEIGENEWLQDIRKQTGRLSELTSSLICLSRMEEDAEPFQMIEFPFSDVAFETAQSFQSLAKARNITLDVQIVPMLSLRGDEKALRQLLAILLDNAVKYSPEGGTVTLSLKKQGRTLLLRVANTTADPVSQDMLRHLFDRFYRADSSRNSKSGGYEIGLSIAHAITAAHKGKITASSDRADHLAVTVILPAG